MYAIGYINGVTPLYLRVRELREANGWSQQELATRAGIGRVAVNRIENKRTTGVDFETLETFAEGLAAADRKHVRIVADPDVSPGGCRLRSADGAVDATLETQIDQIARHLLRREEDES